MIALARTELIKAVRRVRTVVIAVLLVGLPTLIVVAINRRGQRDNGDRGEGLFRLARQSGLVVPAAVLSVMSGFLLIVVAGLFAGDCVAGEASWGNLRYVLMRPVNRSRLLVAKMTVAAAMIWVCVLVVAAAGLLVGILAFGIHPLSVPAIVAGGGRGFVLTTGTILWRVVVAAAYIAFGYSALLAMGAFFSILTDTPTGAIGATVGVYIVSLILDAITQLGTIRYAFPTHYLDAWEPMFTQDHVPRDMAVGVVVQVAYFVVFTTAALTWFSRKDIRS